jgi:hypothetical protein
MARFPRRSGAYRSVPKEGRIFFFEKKKQKTFVHLRVPTQRNECRHPTGLKGEKFFGSFFSKKELLASLTF